MSKVLYVGKYNESENLTGPEKVAKRIFEQSSKKSETFFLEYFFDGKQYGLGKKLFGSEVVEKINGSKVLRLGIFKIPFFLIKHRPEIIHIITFERFAVLCYLYKLISRVRIVFNVHGVVVYENQKHREVSPAQKRKDLFSEKIFMKFSDKLLFLSEATVKIAKNIYHINERKIEYINNGVDEQFHLALKDSKDLNNTLSLIFIGDSDRYDKDFNFLYNSLGKVTVTCSLFVIGEFNEKKFSQCVNLVSIKSIPRMSSEELAKFISDKTIYISSSSYDTFSIAAAECMSTGLAPIVTDTTGISKLVINCKNGFIVKHGDTTVLADKINLLLSDIPLRDKISENASRIYNTLNWPAIFKHYEIIYRSLQA